MLKGRIALIRYGVIGTGWITGAFIGGAAKAGKLSLAAVYSRTRERGEEFAAKYGAVSVFTDLEEMAKSGEIDAVYIASPNSLHFSQSRLFLQNKKHVLCEKPISLNSEEAKRLIALAEEQGVVFMEAIMLLHFPFLKLLEEAVGEIGKISLAKFDFSQLSSKYPAYLNGRIPNVFKAEFAGGSMMDLGIYCIYPVLHLFGEPENVLASAKKFPEGADAAASAVLTYPDKLVNITCSKIGQAYAPSEIQGDKGTILIDNISTLRNMRIVYNDRSIKQLTEDEDKETLMSYEAKSFSRYIESPQEYQRIYRYQQQLAVKVSALLKQIRDLCGIKFPQE